MHIQNVASSRASVPVLRRVSSREARLRALSAPRRAARRARRNVNRHPKTRRFGFCIAGVFGAANDVGAREGVAREVVAARRVTRADGYRRRTRVRTPPSPPPARASFFVRRCSRSLECVLKKATRRVVSPRR